MASRKGLSKRLVNTAYHEAGHVVARHYLHLPFRYATIVPGEDSLGHVLGAKLPKSFQPDINNDLKTRTKIEKMIMSYYAGHAAEFIFTGRHNWKGAIHDNHIIIDLVDYYCGNPQEIELFLDRMWLRTIVWLKQPAHWLAVEAVVKGLLKKKRLDEREVENYIRRVAK